MPGEQRTTTMDLLQSLVYFSHVNKKTQYERPQLGGSSLSNGRSLFLSPIHSHATSAPSKKNWREVG